MIGRDDELNAVRSLLASPPGVVVIEGEPGIGKTTLLRAGVAEARGYTVLQASAAGAETRLSFSTVRDLLDGVFDEIADELPPPRRRALAVTLLREEPDASAPDPGAIGVSLLTALRVLAARRPVLVAIDDIQWLDPGSAAPLAYVMRRLHDEPIAALVTRRPGTRLPDRVPYTTIRLGPVSLGSLGRLLRERLDVTYPRPTLQRLHAATGGNPLFALEAAQVLEPPLAPDAPLPVPATLRALDARSARDAGRRDGAGVADGRGACAPEGRTDRRDALDAAVAANVVTVDGDTVRFVHPLYAAAVYERASEDARRDVHLRLSRVVRGLEERARHLALATETPDERVASVVEAAATAASSRGSPAAAAELIAHARRLTPRRGGSVGPPAHAGRGRLRVRRPATPRARRRCSTRRWRTSRPAGTARSCAPGGRGCGTSPTTSVRAPTSSTPRSPTPARTPRSGPRSRRASRGGCCSCAATSAPRRSTRAPRRAGPSAPATAPRSRRRWPPTP